MVLQKSLNSQALTQLSDQDTTYAVFRAKAPFVTEWTDPRLHDLTKLARRTYQDFYSPDIPLLDEYDAKSAVYLCSATYPSTEFGESESMVREWLSVRFTPFSGEPISNLDLQLQTIFSIDDANSLINAIQQKHGVADEIVTDGLWAISRLCAIRPYIISEKNEEEIIWSQVHLSNSRTLSCFLLMFRQFLQDYKDQYPMQYFTCQIHPKVADKIFTQSHPGYSFELPLASEALGLEPHEIGLDRMKNEAYVFSYPGYFLNISEFVHVIDSLVQSGQLPIEFVESFLPTNVSWQTAVASPHFSYFSKFGNILNATEFPSHIPIRPEAIRQLLRQHVSDGVQLRLLSRQKAEEQIERFPLFQLLQ